jgi:hypothetical protein
MSVTPVAPVTPEFLRGLCDWAVVDSARVAEEGEWIRRGGLLVAEEGGLWPLSRVKARSLHVTPSKTAWDRVEKESWPDLRLVIVHGGDASLLPSMFADFLRRWPAVKIWLQNLMEEPPAEFADRIRVLPLFEKDMRWRRTAADEIITCVGGERETEILFPFCNYTNPLRAVWLQKGRQLRGRREGYNCIPHPISSEDYAEAMIGARAVVCPPGNGIDTHRVWETLYKGGWAIVQENVHTRLLLAEWPDLPLLAISDPEDLVELVVPPQPVRLHPILFRWWWAAAVEEVVRGG